MRRIFTILFICFVSASYGQSTIKVKKPVTEESCFIGDVFDLEKVEIKIMETKQPPDEYATHSETIIKIHGPINKVEDLNATEIEELKKFAVKYRCCIVYIDTKGLWDSSAFPTMASRGQLYCYIVKKK